MKILLTGGNGFIGHNLAIYLKSKGNDVTILDSLSVNNLLSFTDSEIVNQKLGGKLLPLVPQNILKFHIFQLGYM